MFRASSFFSHRRCRFDDDRCNAFSCTFFNRFINDDEVTVFFSGADLVVQPYRSATQSGVTQIAYHFEKPMVVTDVGGLAEIVPDGICGYIVKPEPEKIADALNDYFYNNRQEKLAIGVRLEKAKFTWDKLTASIMEVYNLAGKG